MNSARSASNHEALPQAGDDSAVAQSFGNTFYTISNAADISRLPQDELLRLGSEGEFSLLVPAPGNLGIWICDVKSGRARTNSLTNPTMLVLETESCWEVLTYGHGTQRDFRIGYEYDERFDEFQVRYPFSTLNGCIELVDTLVSHVPLTLKLCDAAAQACDGNYPGVFDYEVSSSFGRWFGEHILEHGNEPSTQVVQAWLANQIEAFFTQGLTEAEALPIRTAIQDALNTDPMPS